MEADAECLRVLTAQLSQTTPVPNSEFVNLMKPYRQPKREFPPKLVLNAVEAAKPRVTHVFERAADLMQAARTLRRGPVDV